MSVRAAVELLLAAAAAVGSVLCWLGASEMVAVAPVLEGEPMTTSVTYSAPLLGLSLFLATVAGVLVVLGVARVRRSTRAARAARSARSARSVTAPK